MRVAFDLTDARLWHGAGVERKAGGSRGGHDQALARHAREVRAPQPSNLCVGVDAAVTPCSGTSATAPCRLMTNAPLRRCESAAKRLYMTDDLRGEERLFIETLLRDEEKALAPPKKGLRTSRTAEAKVTEVKAEVKAPQTDVKSPQTEVTAPQTEVTAPQTEVKAPQTEVAAPQAEVTAPQTEVTAPQTEVKAEAMPQ